MIKASKYYFEWHELGTRRVCEPIVVSQLLRSWPIGMNSLDKTPFATERMHICMHFKDHKIDKNTPFSNCWFETGCFDIMQFR